MSPEDAVPLDDEQVTENGLQEDEPIAKDAYDQFVDQYEAQIDTTRTTPR